MKTWKIEELKPGVSKFKDSNGDIVTYEAHNNRIMFFYSGTDDVFIFMEDYVRENYKFINCPKRGWKDLTIEEACVLIKNTKNVWYRDDSSVVNRGIIFGYSQRMAFKYELSGGIHWHHASMYNDQGEPADDYEGLGL